MKLRFPSSLFVDDSRENLGYSKGCLFYGFSGNPFISKPFLHIDSWNSICQTTSTATNRSWTLELCFDDDEWILPRKSNCSPGCARQLVPWFPVVIVSLLPSLCVCVCIQYNTTLRHWLVQQTWRGQWQTQVATQLDLAWFDVPGCVGSSNVCPYFNWLAKMVCSNWVVNWFPPSRTQIVDPLPLCLQLRR